MRSRKCDIFILFIFYIISFKGLIYNISQKRDRNTFD